MRVTREEVAKLANVSGPTVSYVFNKTRYVSEEVRTRVAEAAKKLNYQPDMIARSMVKKETNTISVLTNDISSPLQMEVIKGLQEKAMDNGFFVNVCGGEKNLEIYIDNFISRRIDGVFVSVEPEKMKEEHIIKLLDYGISVLVTATRKINDARICKLEPDFREGMKSALLYLKELKHRKIAYISAFDENYDNDKRLNIFKSCMKSIYKNENPLLQLGEYPFHSTIESGYHLAKKLLDKNEAFTAVICTNDLMAMGAIKAFHEKNINVPRDISVIGIDDILFASAYYPGLTTIGHNHIKYGERIFEILLDNIRTKRVTSELFNTNLVIRDSCTVAPF